MNTAMAPHKRTSRCTSQEPHRRLAELSDSELLEAFRADCTEAYGVLFRRYEKPALRVALRRTQNHHTATDAVSEAFASILSALTAGKGPVGTFKSYLYTSVTREVQRQHRLQRHEITLPEFPDGPSDAPDLSEQLPDPALQKAFMSLPPRWQQVIWHLDINEIPPREAAPLFGITPNAVAALHRRAKNGLRQAYLQHTQP